MLDPEFFCVATQAFNPFTPNSGTEHAALLLYSLARILRPRTIVEYGSGYSTLFLLRALAENAGDIRDETELLFRKTAACGDGARIATLSPSDPIAAAWLGTGGKACGVDPGYYLRPYVARLFSFEDQQADHPYCLKMREAVQKLGLQEFLVQLPCRGFSHASLPSSALPIDLAWNDEAHYLEFFDQCWPSLNPDGGLMIFHNTTASRPFWEAVQCMRERRTAAGDLEVLTLPEPHKLNQNSCTILRRTSAYQPSFERRKPAAVAADAVRFMAAVRS